MILEVENPETKHKIEVGDVVVVNGSSPYLVVKQDDGFVAKSFCGRFGATGVHNTLNGLINSLNRHEYTHYSHHDFKLSLTKRR